MTAWADVPRIFPHSIIMGLTPDNANAISDYSGTVMFFDLESGEDPKIFAANDNTMLSYGVGMGNFAANGSIVGTRGSKLGSSIFRYGVSGIVNGRWATLTDGNTNSDMGMANGITADGSRICGTAATGAEFGGSNVMVTPCYWDIAPNDNGTRHALPFPDKDFAGMSPQYITAICISDDGRTIVGQQRSGNGMLHEFLVYQQADDNTWSYFKPFADLVNPNKRTLPENPGEGPEIPSQETYMTQEQIDAFTTAFDAYVAELETNPAAVPPTYETYMSPDSITKYNEAVKATNAWQQSYERWNRAITAVMDESTNFQFNQVALSPNGRYLGCTAEKTVYHSDLTSTSVHTPYLYDLKERKVIINDGPDLSITSVSNDGDLLGYERKGDIDFGYFLEAGSTEWEPLHEYISEQHPELADWFKENWTHEVEVVEIVDGEEDVTWQTMTFGGLPIASRDFNYVVSNLYVFWTDAPAELASDYAGYLLPLKKSDENSISDIEVPSTVNNELFDLQGRRVTKPGHGLYISKGRKILR